MTEYKLTVPFICSAWPFEFYVTLKGFYMYIDANLLLAQNIYKYPIKLNNI